ncbi:MAG: hypothetical protein PVI03_05515 [Candidatus Thorarchaeota archaeon]|jgi:hypothetical protein
MEGSTMNGRMAKQIRRVAANPQLSEETKYKGIEHRKTLYLARLRGDGQYEYEPVPITRIQVVMGPCQRQHYKVWKNRYKHFVHRSDTLPYRGLNASMGG